jgi:RHS repeat-associated protein
LGVPCADAWSSTTPPARPSTPNFSDNYDYNLFGGIASGLSGENTYGNAAHPHAVMETSAGQRVMTYNAAGELELLTSKSGSGASEVSRSEDYVWDRMGRLSATTVNSTTGGVTSNVTIVRNRYDVDRQRVLRIEDKPGTAPDSVTVFLPGMDFTVTVDAAGVRSHKINRYLSIAGTTVAVRSVTTGGGWTIDWLLGNHQGSITASVRSGTGAVTRNWFDPYGGERGSSTMVTDRDFLGQETDTAVGLSYLNNRYYDPAVGMFLSVDPLVAKTGEAYVYGASNPSTLSDPTGLEPGCGRDASGTTCSDAHGDVSRVTGKKSVLTSAQKQTLDTDEVEKYIGAQVVTCEQWLYDCLDVVARPDDHWDLSDPGDAAKYEATRVAYVWIRSLIEGGVYFLEHGVAMPSVNRTWLTFVRSVSYRDGHADILVEHGPDESTPLTTVFGFVSDVSGYIALGCILSTPVTTAAGAACATVAGAISAGSGALEVMSGYIEGADGNACRTGVFVAGALLPGPGSTDSLAADVVFGVSRHGSDIAAGQSC